MVSDDAGGDGGIHDGLPSHQTWGAVATVSRGLAKKDRRARKGNETGTRWMNHTNHAWNQPIPRRRLVE